MQVAEFGLLYGRSRSAMNIMLLLSFIQGKYLRYYDLFETVMLPSDMQTKSLFFGGTIAIKNSTELTD